VVGDVFVLPDLTEQWVDDDLDEPDPAQDVEDNDSPEEQQPVSRIHSFLLSIQGERLFSTSSRAGRDQLIAVRGDRIQLTSSQIKGSWANP
jgi:hypothetical protein